MRARLSGSERRRLIVKAAATVFAKNGIVGATTKQIAVAAGISPALLYEHFPSKQAIYRAVLRQLVRDHDALIPVFWRSFKVNTNTDGGNLIHLLYNYFHACVFAKDTAIDEAAHRVFLSSLASDGVFARLIFRRGQRWGLKSLTEMLDDARRRGDVSDQGLSSKTAFCIIDHVGVMLLSTHLQDSPTASYGEEGENLVRQAVLFCGRGLGFSEGALAAALDIGAVPAATQTAAGVDAASGKCLRLRQSADQALQQIQGPSV